MSFRTEAEVYGALKKRFRAPTYAILPGVADATGANQRRTIDAIVMGLWPSRGLAVHGIEIKTRRGDWLRELKSPEKQETIARFCDRFWLAVGDKEVIQDGELPDSWGLLVPHGKGLRAAVDAPPREAQPLTRGFVAAILRRAHEAQTDPDVERRVREELRSEYEKNANELAKLAESSTRKENVALRKRIKELERLEKIENALRICGWTTDFEIENMCSTIRKIGSGRNTLTGRIDHATNLLKLMIEDLGHVKESLERTEDD